MQTVLNRIVDAVESIYSPRSTNEIRKAAQAYCEQLKDDQMAPVYGRFLADWSRPQSGVIRHFGLSLLENSLRYKWQKYSEQERQLIRDCSVELAQQYANLPATQSCENYLVEKLVCVFSELTEREWPQRWPQLNDLLEQLFQIAVSYSSDS
jgi:exportin-5